MSTTKQAAVVTPATTAKQENAKYYGRTIAKTADCDGILKNSIRPASLRLAIMQKICKAKTTDEVMGTVATAADGRQFTIHVGEVRSAVLWGLITLGGKAAPAVAAGPAKAPRKAAAPKAAKAPRKARAADDIAAAA